MSNPYAPPSSQEEHPGTPSNRDRDTTLRRIGALSTTVQLVRLWWNSFSNFNNLPLSAIIAGASAGTLFLGVFIYGFLRGGRKSHFGILLFIAFSLISQAYTLWYIAPHQQPGQWNPWLSFALQASPTIIAFFCATALYLRAVRAESSGR